MTRFSDVKTAPINEAFIPDELLSYTYPHFSSPFPLIIINKTAKAYLVAWRTKSVYRECWITKKAITRISDELPHHPELRNSYKMVWIQHWYIQSTQSDIYSNSNNKFFFDEWNAALERLRDYRYKMKNDTE